MTNKEKELTQLNDQLSHPMKVILKCTVPSEKYGRLLLASPPNTRYPYIYPRDSSSAVQLFRRLAGSRHGYDVVDQSFKLNAGERLVEGTMNANKDDFKRPINK